VVQSSTGTEQGKKKRGRGREREREERKNTVRHRDEKEVSTNPDRRGSTRARRSPSLSAPSAPFLLIAPTGVAAGPLISFNRLLFFSLPTRATVLSSDFRREGTPGELEEGTRARDDVPGEGVAELGCVTRPRSGMMNLARPDKRGPDSQSHAETRRR